MLIEFIDANPAYTRINEADLFEFRRELWEVLIEYLYFDN
ncbi:MAG: hypothetical protein Sv326_0084 [Candidatus Fermentimicrarchaeum limneticum]|uniref:Uncharacterized protein n=1 Tax=Fermentimicrarchaeum limneticum TaxID=2795018 RepID=A0A7D6BBL4_FERL1|nr:MAG: hypothetical protein Sv326_0084 [Candidatus Fermentimicrarchaeum limneticum]